MNQVTTLLLLSLVASHTLATPHVNTNVHHELFAATRRPVNSFSPASITTNFLFRQLKLKAPIVTSSTALTTSAVNLPTLARPGLNVESCSTDAECEVPRSCVEFDADSNALVCEGGDCICTNGATCTTAPDCSAGESCTTLESGAMLCISNVVLSGQTLDFMRCTSSAQCAPGRACFGSTLTNGVLDCFLTSCSCLLIESNCATFQDCLVGTSCTRISPEIAASFCVANSFIVGNFPSGLTLSGCTTDADCAGVRSCLDMDDAGNVVPCTGGTECLCAGGGANVICTSSRFCDFGETCVLSDDGGACRAVADVI